MKIDRISYQRNYPVGAYQSEKIGVEATVDEGESVQDALNACRDLVEKIHKDKYPHLYADGIYPKHKEEPFVQIREEAPVAESPEEKRWIAITDGCFSLTELEKWHGKCPQWIFDRRSEQLYAKILQ
jgi:hypothetical protein